MRWFWRIKTWSAVVSVTMTNVSSGLTYDVTGSGNIAMSGPLIAHDQESDMTIYGQHRGLIPVEYRRSGALEGTGTLTVLMFQDSAAGISDSGVAGVENAYRPHMSINLSSDIVPSINNVSSFSSVSATFDILGHSVTLFNTTATNHTWTGNITVTPSSYWTFAERDGSNPIYNGATGVQLLNPFAFDATP